MPAEASPTARALRVLEILRARPGSTAAEIGERLGVTDRAARRYVAVLREAGVEVASLRGPGGGYRLGRGTRLPPVLFTQEEALGLVMSVLVDADGAAGAALDKVVRALPEAAARQATLLREHAATRPARSTPRPDPLVTSALVDGVAARRRLRLTYTRADGTTVEAEVDPWAVVARHGLWYLLCHAHAHGVDAVRTYRVDRVGSVVATDVGFTPPVDLDPYAALEEHLGTGWDLATRVVLDAPPDVVARWVRPVLGRLEPCADGTLLTGSTGNPAMYAEWLACVPLGLRVEGGPELRAAVAALGGRLRDAVRPEPS